MRCKAANDDKQMMHVQKMKIVAVTGVTKVNIIASKKRNYSFWVAGSPASLQ